MLTPTPLSNVAALGQMQPRGHGRHETPARTRRQGRPSRERRDLRFANLATQCVVCGHRTTSRPIRPEPWFPATAGRMRLFPGLPSSEGRRRRHRTVGASLDFANLATQCVVCATTSRPIRPEPWFPATAGRMRLFPGLPSSEGRRRRHRTVGASLDFARSREEPPGAPSAPGWSRHRGVSVGRCSESKRLVSWKLLLREQRLVSWKLRCTFETTVRSLFQDSFQRLPLHCLALRAVRRLTGQGVGSGTQ